MYMLVLLLFAFASWWLNYPGGLIKAEFECNMLCMLYVYVYALPVYPSHYLGLNSILRILTSILQSSATRDPVDQW